MAAKMTVNEQSGSYKRFPWPPRVQVAGVSSLEEALFCARVGVDALGFTLGLPHGPHDGLLPHHAARIISGLPEGILPVVITYLDTAEEVRELVYQTGAGAVQFHGGIEEQELVRFRRLCPTVRTIGRVTVSDSGAVAVAARFAAPLWDAIILDSHDPSRGRIGATGLTHDWSLSAGIVRESSLPVILAGGLNPDNVAEAILAVRPAGVDAHTGLEESDGRRSFNRIKAFTERAREALASLEAVPDPA